MTSLYSDAHFETDVDQIISKMQGPGVPLDQIVAWLDKRTEEETFSLTDIWAVLTSATIMKQVPLQYVEHTFLPHIYIYFMKQHCHNNRTPRFSTKCFAFHQLELWHLSKEANRIAINPYPIYSAVEREFTSEKPENGTITCTSLAHTH